MGSTSYCGCSIWPLRDGSVDVTMLCPLAGTSPFNSEAVLRCTHNVGTEAAGCSCQARTRIRLLDRNDLLPAQHALTSLPDTTLHQAKGVICFSNTIRDSTASHRGDRQAPISLRCIESSHYGE